MEAFFDHIRSRIFGGRLRQSQVDGINAILNATVGLPISHRAYILATAAFETAWTVQPIREYGQGKGRTYGKPGKHGGQIAYGRGFAQLTWDRNYEKADKELGLDGALVADYDLALDPEIAADILVRGCSEGWFTGKKLSDYLPGDYVNARRVVNGTDKAHQIAAQARTFEDALRLAEMPQDGPVVVEAPTQEPVPPVVVEPVAPVEASETKEPAKPQSEGIEKAVAAFVASVLGMFAAAGFEIPSDVSEIAMGVGSSVITAAVVWYVRNSPKED